MQIKENQVNALKHFGRGFLVFAVKRHDGQARFLVLAAVYLRACINRATETMLRRVNLLDVNAQRKQRVHQMRFSNNARLVADHTNSFSSQKWKVIIQLHGSGNIVFLVNNNKLRGYQIGWLLRFDSVVWLVVHLEDLGLGWRKESA